MRPNDRRLAEGALLTDHYQLTMAQLYFFEGLHEREARFEYFFRKYPSYGSHHAGFCVNAGLGWLLEWMRESRVRHEDIDRLRKMTDSVSGAQMFHDEFLHWLLEQGRFDRLRLQAVPEGRVVHPDVPLLVVEGPLALGQLIESSVLNHLNYPTLVATKAARIRQVAMDQPILEFGLRRGPERGVSAGTRAALIGGVDYSSNVGISQVLGFPSKGTHAHSMVQAFLASGRDELDAFRAYATRYPDECILLVDTIDTLGSGVPNAIKVFHELRDQGHAPVGVRLDSGDMAYLSIQAAKMFDAEGFDDVKIVLSNQLDELVIWQILSQIEHEAPRYGVDADRLIRRLVFGVGTRLLTSEGDPSLDGVYKLAALRAVGAGAEGAGGDWMPAMKLSESPAKTLNPGEKRVWRLYDRRNKAIADVLSRASEDLRTMPKIVLRHAQDPAKSRTLVREQLSKVEMLLEAVSVGEGPAGGGSAGAAGAGRPEREAIERMRERCRADVEQLDDGVKRIINPHTYHVSLTDALWELKQEMVRTAKQQVA